MKLNYIDDIIPSGMRGWESVERTLEFIGIQVILCKPQNLLSNGAQYWKNSINKTISIFKEPPVKRWCIKYLNTMKHINMSVKFCITSLPRQLLQIKASPFATFVNIETFRFAFRNSLTTWILGYAFEITLIASWIYEYTAKWAGKNQPTKVHSWLIQI